MTTESYSLRDLEDMGVQLKTTKYESFVPAMDDEQYQKNRNESHQQHRN